MDRLAWASVTLESLPDEVLASMQIRDAWRRAAAHSGEGLEFLISDLSRWPPGATVRVAFLDGAPDLHADVAAATKQITDSCNIVLDFGPDQGTFRTWTEADSTHVAEIRVSFDQPGYWSLVGTDSTDTSIGSASGPLGGRPHQRSLNLGGFEAHRPDDWRGTVRHEFLHALGFHHAHQNMRGPCETAFRWEDDSGYIPSQDPNGMFVPDEAGRRPGIYTYLAGEPNGWPRQKVDNNLRVEEDPNIVAGPFDPESVMLYRFADFFYRETPSPCAPAGDGVDLSAGDKRGLQLLYPSAANDLASIAAESKRALTAVVGESESGLEATVGTAHSYEGRLIQLLSARAAVV